MPAENFYELLGVNEDANSAAIKRAYRKLVLEYHPDRTGSDPKKTKRFRRIQQAYETLIDPAKRRRYNEKLKYGPLMDLFKLARKERNDFANIRLKVSEQSLLTGEFVEVTITTIYRNPNIQLRGLRNFRVISGPLVRHFRHNKHPERMYTVIHYVLEPRVQGYVQLGPAAIVQGDVVLLSQPKYLNVSETSYSRIRKMDERVRMWIYRIMAGFAALVIGLILWNVVQDIINPDRHKKGMPDIKVNYNYQLPNGTAPYDKFMDYKAVDYSLYNQLTVTNQSKWDALVLLEDPLSGRAVRNHYVQQGSTSKIKGLPNGYYRLKVMFGKDWDSRKAIENSFLKGGFNKGTTFVAYPDEEQWLYFSQHETEEDSLQYVRYHIELNGTAAEKDYTLINQEAFFEGLEP